MKVLDIRMTSSQDFRAFLNEARTMRLRHPHIVRLLDFGMSRDDHPFLVMEYAPEGTLRDRHPKGSCIPLPTIVSYVDQIASALEYAHNQRIIHRDIKPENILVRTDETLLVSDFGIAKLLEQSVLISAQTQVGTPVYMAPEQHRGYPCTASDQYALGNVVYEWICGMRPFQGSREWLALQHVAAQPPSLRSHLPQLPEAIERVVLKALAKDPGDRFGTIQEFASALREAVQPSPSVAPEPATEVSRMVSPKRGEGVLRKPPLSGATSGSDNRAMMSEVRVHWHALSQKTKILGIMLVMLLLVVTTVGVAIMLFSAGRGTPLSDEQQARSVVDRYYAAINSKDYLTAYNLRASKGSYEDFVNGFADTKHDDYQLGQILRQSDGTVQVDITLIATSTSSKRTTYQGLYIIGQQPDGSWKIVGASIREMARATQTRAIFVAFRSSLVLI